MNDMVKDKSGKVCAAKMAYWITLISCLVKIFMQESPDYSGLALFLSPVAATYFGRNWSKEHKKDA